MKVRIDYAQKQFVFLSPSFIPFFSPVSINIPFDKIKGLVGFVPTEFFRGYKMHGVNLPFYLGTKGTFYHNGEKNYWYTSSDNDIIQVELEESSGYNNIYFNQKNPEKTISEMLMAMRNKETAKKYYGCESEKISLDVNEEGKVYGTVTRPQKLSKHPAVLLIPGSGPTDRDWLNPQLPGKNGSGRLIANELAELGFVSLRYDKRGVGESLPCNKYSWDTYLDEQKACLDYLASRDYVDSDNLFVIGHSEGSLHALKLAQSSAGSKIKGLVLLASPAMSMKEILLVQLKEQLSAALPTDVVEKELKGLAAGFDSIMAAKPVSADSILTLPPLKDLYTKFMSEQTIELSRELLFFDPCTEILKVEVPVLICGGMKDTQVNYNKQTEVLYAAAKAGGKQNVKLIGLPNSDHHFKLETTPLLKISPQQAMTYSNEDRTIDPQFIDLLYDGLCSFLPQHLELDDDMLMYKSENSIVKKLE